MFFNFLVVVMNMVIAVILEIITGNMMLQNRSNWVSLSNMRKKES